MSLHSRLASLALLGAVPLLFTACPDPTATTDGGDQPLSMQPPGGGEGGGPGGPGGQEGGPGAGGGAGGQPVGGGRPNPPGFTVKAGEGVKLSGVVAYTGTKTGTIRLDFLKQGATNSFPELVHSMTLDKLGPFEVEAPKDAGDLWIVAFLDSNNNGPDPTEPAARVPETIKVAAAPVTGITLTLSDTPDLGSLKPGGEAGAGGPGAEGKGAPGMEGKGGPGMEGKGMEGKGAPGAEGAPGMPPGADGKGPDAPKGGPGAPPAGTAPPK